jgi:hypothetical protein
MLSKERKLLIVDFLSDDCNPTLIAHCISPKRDLAVMFKKSTVSNQKSTIRLVPEVPHTRKQHR